MKIKGKIDALQKMCFVVKCHEIVLAVIIMEMIREQASTICLARVWLLEIGEMISAIKLRDRKSVV